MVKGKKVFTLKVSTLIFILVLAGSAFATGAIFGNWHKLTEIVGFVNNYETVVPIKVDLGALEPMQSFSVDATTNITRISNFTVPKLIIAIPSNISEWYTMVGGFKDLYLKITIDVLTLSLPDIPVIVDGSSAINPGIDSAYWKFELQETSLSYYSYKDWNPLIPEFICPPVDHTVYITVAGETSMPTSQVNFAMTLYLEITPNSESDHVVINEVLYDALVESNRPQREWFEIYNPTSSSVDLYGYVIEDNVHRMKIDAHVVLAPGEFVVVCNNVTAFREDNPSYAGKLIEEVNTASKETDSNEDDGNAVPLSYTEFTHEDVYLNNGGDWLKLYFQDPGPNDLNGSAYLVDAVAWESMPSDPDFNPPQSSDVGSWNTEDVEDGYSIQRSPNGQDTNNCTNDFFVYPAGNLHQKTSPGITNTVN